jgi:hypothetical protein
MDVTRFALSFLCVLGLLFTGCGDADDSSQYGEWTVAGDSLQLTEDLRVSETENFYFGSATALDVTSEGRMVVSDHRANNIKVLRPDGTLLDTLGGPGEGPGEFQQVAHVQVARGDSLYAYDFRQSRLTVFEPAAPYRVSRLVSIPREEGFVSRMFVLEKHIVGGFGGGFRSPEEGIQTFPPRTMRLIQENGRPSDSLFQVQRGKLAVSEMDRGFRAHPLPFRRTTRMYASPNARFYYGWTDSLHVKARTLGGEPEVIASIPTEPVPVTEAARDSALSDLDGEIRNVVASGLPDNKPAFTQLLVAETGRLWIKRPTTAPDAETAPWWVLNPETQTIQKTKLPAAVSLTVVTNDYAYGTTRTDLGAPAVVRYRMES